MFYNPHSMLLYRTTTHTQYVAMSYNNPQTVYIDVIYSTQHKYTDIIYSTQHKYTDIIYSTHNSVHI